LARLADEVSLGKLDAADFAGGSDEIGVLGMSFNRMKKSLVEAMKLLD
ncbi:MAG: HAMP domain-containing protein, partial [Rhodocyclaceae bacterium]|nr:HAMP domain-containing protein [Rhodocyclaceae bacterium]